MVEQAEQTLLQNPGVLWQRTIEQTKHALSCGALRSIPTTYEFVEQNGVQFLVRLVTNLIRKEEDLQKQKQVEAVSGKDVNPFLPYDKDLFIVDISDTHVCLLNKFNVADYHLLIITRAFEEQEALLTLKDFEAMWACLAEMNGLVFYNAGQAAGASQRHKHLQLVPLPFADGSVRMPIDILSAKVQDGITALAEFPFVHACVKLDPTWVTSPAQAAEPTLQIYRKLLQTVGLQTDQPMQSAPYNLLVTREWMLVVPRSRAAWSSQTQNREVSIEVNSLGFAGALLARDAIHLEQLKHIRPLNLLKNVAVSI